MLHTNRKESQEQHNVPVKTEAVSQPEQKQALTTEQASKSTDHSYIPTLTGRALTFILLLKLAGQMTFDKSSLACRTARCSAISEPECLKSLPRYD